jgi:hypothetical protein
MACAIDDDKSCDTQDSIMITAREYSTRELAEAQLSAAIDLYLAGDYVPAITLAGAAEELFGSQLAPKQHGLYSAAIAQSRMPNAEGHAFSILNRVITSHMLESLEHGTGQGAHSRMTEVGTKHLEVLQKTESAARSQGLLQPARSTTRDPRL